MKTLFIIGLVWPEPTSTGAGSRMLQLIHLFLEQDYQIIFASAAEKSPNSFNLSSIGVIEQSIELNASSFDRLIAELNPEIVLFDRFIIEEQYGWRVSAQCPDSIKILDTEDLHCLRKEREKSCKKGIDFEIKSLLKSDIAKREIASIYRCDLSLIISSYEMMLLKDVFKVNDRLLCVLPFLYDLGQNKINDSLPFTERDDFITIGNFLHEPNFDSVVYLKTVIWPKIRRQLPKANMKVFGAYASQKVHQLQNEKEGFIIKGRAKNALEELGKAKVCLAPIRFGAGIKTKLVESMLSGTPSVTTLVGAEGFEYVEWGGFVNTNPEAFANNAVKLFVEETLWVEKQQIGYTLLHQFDKMSYRESLMKRVKYLKDNLAMHRADNFIGSMLQHHTLQSTKYLSKWIEQKNRKA